MLLSEMMLKTEHKSVLYLFNKDAYEYVSKLFLPTWQELISLFEVLTFKGGFLSTLK